MRTLAVAILILGALWLGGIAGFLLCAMLTSAKRGDEHIAPLDRWADAREANTRLLADLRRQSPKQERRLWS